MVTELLADSLVTLCSNLTPAFHAKDSQEGTKTEHTLRHSSKAALFRFVAIARFRAFRQRATVVLVSQQAQRQLDESA
jgi:hypothetical protein